MMKIGVVGCGISGVACGNILKKCGHDVTIFESSNRIGGLWTKAYPQLRLQNTGAQYRMYDSDYEGGLEENEQPHAHKVLRHIVHTVEKNKLNVLTGHRVVSVRPIPGEQNSSLNSVVMSGENGWIIESEFKDEDDKLQRKTQNFEKVIIATGQHFEPKPVTEHNIPGLETCQGKILLGRDVTTDSISSVASGNVAVLGFGKTSLDMCTLISSLQPKTKEVGVNHVFREARWLLPLHILGIHYTHILFARFSTTFMPCWGHPTMVAKLVNSVSIFHFLFIVVQ